MRNKVGGECDDNIAVSPALQVALDAETIDSALSRVETTWVFGL